MKQIINTSRLIFRELSINDLEKFHELENNPDVIKYIPNMKQTTLYESKNILKNHIANYDKRDGLGVWAVVIKQESDFAGITGLRYLNDLNKVEIGIRLFPDYWGNGYATEVGKALIKYGFNKLRLNEIIAMALPENDKSMKSLENIGLEFDRIAYYKGSNVAFFKALRGKVYW